MKKFTIIFLLLAVKFSSAQAGAYVGMGVGANILGGKMNYSAMSAGADLSGIDSAGLRDTAMLTEFMTGYGYIWNSVYLGVEGNYQLSQAKYQFIGRSDPRGEFLKIKLKNSYGVSFRCGYCIVENSLVYLRAGWESRKMSLSFHTGNNGLLPVIKNYRDKAFVPGVGMETKLNNHLALRLETKAAFYSKKSVNVSGTRPMYTKVQAKPRIYSVLAALTYTF